MNNAQPEILVVDDDKDLVQMLDERLTREGFKVRKVFDGASAYRTVLNSPPSLMLLDLILPEMRGMDVCQKMKADPKTANIPIIMLTANSDEIDVVLGLELGADDYVTKPFGLRQLVARIRAVLRRNESPLHKATVQEFGPLKFDRGACEVEISGKNISLTQSEFDILFFLANHEGEVVKRSELLSLLSNSKENLVERNVDVHVGSLRKKLGNFGKVIGTIRNVGYRFLIKGNPLTSMV